MPFVATWRDLEMITLREVSQREKNIIRYHSYVKSKIMTQMNLFTKETHRLQNQSYGYQKGNIVVGRGEG